MKKKINKNIYRKAIGSTLAVVGPTRPLTAATFASRFVVGTLKYLRALQGELRVRLAVVVPAQIAVERWWTLRLAVRFFAWKHFGEMSRKKNERERVG